MKKCHKYISVGLCMCLLLCLCACSMEYKLREDVYSDKTDTKPGEEADRETGQGTKDGLQENGPTEDALTEGNNGTAAGADKESGNENDGEGETMKAATLLYQGHASLRIVTEDGKVIYIDPFKGSGYDLPADLILITHSHYDHTQTDLIQNKNDDCRTITQKEALKDGVHQSFDFDFVKVEAVEAGYNKNHDVKECVGYVLTFRNGARVYVSGDTSKTPQMAELEDIDYAFLCCDGVYNMDVAEAKECAKEVNAKHSIPYHMIPADNPDGFDQAVAESFDVEGQLILRPGEELRLEAE